MNSENKVWASGSKVVIKYISDDGKVGAKLPRVEDFELKIDWQVLSLISFPSAPSPLFSYHLSI